MKSAHEVSERAVKYVEHAGRARKWCRLCTESPVSQVGRRQPVVFGISSGDKGRSCRQFRLLGLVLLALPYSGQHSTSGGLTLSH